MQVLRIESLEDPRVAHYHDVRDADLRRRQGRFMAEGRLVVEILLRASRFRADSLFVTPTVLEALRPTLEAAEGDVPIYVAAQELFNAVVGYDLHRGCLAVGRVGAESSPASLLSETQASDAMWVVVEGFTNTENVGGVFRNALAFGSAGVLLCPRSCDPLYRKSIRVSMGATLRVPFARSTDWLADLDMIRAAGIRVLALHPDPEADDLARLDDDPALSSGRIAWLLGSEGGGLSEAALDRADHRFCIPMASGVDSLNVATASGIALQRGFAGRFSPSTPHSAIRLVGSANE